MVDTAALPAAYDAQMRMPDIRRDPSVNADARSRPDLDAVRRYHWTRLNDALRRPQVWGNELAITLFMDAMAFVDGLDEAWRQEQEQLKARGAAGPTGVPPRFAAILPGYHDEGAVASVYGDIAWRLGWLTADRTLPSDGHRRLHDGTVAWSERNRNLDQAVTEFGPPSVWFGGTNARYSKTLAYAADDRHLGLVHLHFASTYDWNAPQPQPESPPVLVAVRHGDGAFSKTFTFTPAGATHRPKDSSNR